MPSLKLFGRRTPFAGDDLRTFLILDALFRSIQIALALSLLYFAIQDIITDEFADLEDSHDCAKEREAETDKLMAEVWSRGRE